MRRNQSRTQQHTRSNSMNNTSVPNVHKGHNHGGQIKKTKIFTRDPSNILDNLAQDYVDELACAKSLNPNVT